MRRPVSRRGTVLVFVLAVSLIVTAIGLSALHVARLQSNGLAAQGDFDKARNYAQAAIDLAFFVMNEKQPAGWRETFSLTPIALEVVMPGGSLTLACSDPADGDLVDDPTEAIVLTGTGYCGDARCRIEVQMEPKGSLMTVIDGSWRWVVD